MKLNHLNLPVPDVAATRAFFEQYFDFKCIETKGNDLLSVLIGDDGFSLVLMGNQFNRNGNATYPDALHVGFLMDTKDEVNTIYDRLKKGGILPANAPSNMRGVYGFYFHAPGNILTEVSTIHA